MLRVEAETRGYKVLQEGGDSASSNQGIEGTMNLSVWSRDVKHSNHIVALERRCFHTTRAALVHRDMHRKRLSLVQDVTALRIAKTT